MCPTPDAFSPRRAARGRYDLPVPPIAVLGDAPARGVVQADQEIGQTPGPVSHPTDGTSRSGRRTVMRPLSCRPWPERHRLDAPAAGVSGLARWAVLAMPARRGPRTIGGPGLLKMWAVGAVRRWILASGGLVAVLLGLTGCGAVSSAAAHSTTTTVPATTTTPPRPTTTTPAPGASSLTVEPAIEPRLTDDFNPFDTASVLGRMGVPSFIYEPLIEFNELQVEQYYPWLAESWALSTSGQTITFNLRPGVTWDDGSPFSATDVAYTFNLVKANPGLGYDLPIVSAIATSPMTFTLTLSQPGYSLLYKIAQVPIVKNGYAGDVAPRSYVDTHPDGTGPYYLAHPGDASPGRRRAHGPPELLAAGRACHRPTRVPRFFEQ